MLEGGVDLMSGAFAFGIGVDRVTSPKFGFRIFDLNTKMIPFLRYSKEDSMKLPLRL